MLRRIFSLMFALCLCLALSIGASAVTTSAEAEPFAHEMVQYYRFHGEDAWGHIDDLLEKMTAKTPNQARYWKDIMEGWSWANTRMPVYGESLPDGLPQDDSLAIVVLGYNLNDNGSMKPELLDRLEVAQAAAEKYPNALLILTGGATAEDKPELTEAKAMADFLKGAGISESRMILEDAALTTTENARNVYHLLTESYPQVEGLAIVTSDYHVRWTSAMFTVISRFESGYNEGKPLEVIGNAGCKTEKDSDGMQSQARGVCVITGITFREDAKAPELSIPAPADRFPTEPVTQPAEETQAPQNLPEPTVPAEEPEKKTNFLPIVLVLLVVAVIVWVLTPKKPRKRRQRPEWPEA